MKKWIIIATLCGHDVFAMNALEKKQNQVAEQLSKETRKEVVPGGEESSENREEDFVKDKNNYALLKEYIDQEQKSVASAANNALQQTYHLRYHLAPLWQNFYLAFKKKYGTKWDDKKIEDIYLREKTKITGNGAKSIFFALLGSYLTKIAMDQSFFDDVDISVLMQQYCEVEQEKKDKAWKQIADKYRAKFGEELTKNNTTFKKTITECENPY